MAQESPRFAERALLGKGEVPAASFAARAKHGKRQIQQPDVSMGSVFQDSLLGTDPVSQMEVGTERTMPGPFFNYGGGTTQVPERVGDVQFQAEGASGLVGRPGLETWKELAKTDPRVRRTLANALLEQADQVSRSQGKTEEDFLAARTPLIEAQMEKARGQLVREAFEAQLKSPGRNPLGPAPRMPKLDDFSGRFQGQNPEVLRRAESLAESGFEPGVHRPPLSDEEVSGAVYGFLRAAHEGKVAEFRKKHPTQFRIATGAGVTARFVGSAAVAGGAGRLLGAGAKALGVGKKAAKTLPLGMSSPIAKGTAQLAAGDVAMQAGEMVTGTREELDPVQSAWQTFFGMLGMGVTAKLATKAMKVRLKKEMAAAAEKGLHRAGPEGRLAAAKLKATQVNEGLKQWLRVRGAEAAGFGTMGAAGAFQQALADPEFLEEIKTTEGIGTELAGLLAESAVGGILGRFGPFAGLGSESKAKAQIKRDAGKRVADLDPEGMGSTPEQAQAVKTINELGKKAGPVEGRVAALIKRSAAIHTVRGKEMSTGAVPDSVRQKVLQDLGSGKAHVGKRFKAMPDGSFEVGVGRKKYRVIPKGTDAEFSAILSKAEKTHGERGGMLFSDPEVARAQADQFARDVDRFLDETLTGGIIRGVRKVHPGTAKWIKRQLGWFDDPVFAKRWSDIETEFAKLDGDIREIEGQFRILESIEGFGEQISRDMFYQAQNFADPNPDYWRGKLGPDVSDTTIRSMEKLQESVVAMFARYGEAFRQAGLIPEDTLAEYRARWELVEYVPWKYNPKLSRKDNQKFALADMAMNYLPTERAVLDPGAVHKLVRTNFRKRRKTLSEARDLGLRDNFRAVLEGLREQHRAARMVKMLEAVANEGGGPGLPKARRAVHIQKQAMEAAGIPLNGKHPDGATDAQMVRIDHEFQKYLKLVEDAAVLESRNPWMMSKERYENEHAPLLKEKADFEKTLKGIEKEIGRSAELFPHKERLVSYQDSSDVRTKQRIKVSAALARINLHLELNFGHHYRDAPTDLYRKPPKGYLKDSPLYRAVRRAQTVRRNLLRQKRALSDMDRTTPSDPTATQRRAMERSIAMSDAADQIRAELKAVQAELEGWTQLPNERAWGPLAGKYVRKDIMSEVRTIAGRTNALGKVWDAIHLLAKKSWTARNPTTHAFNVGGNFFSNDMMGMSILDAPEYYRAYKHLRAHAKGKVVTDPIWKEFLESGRMTATAPQVELMASERLSRVMDRMKEKFRDGEHGEGTAALFEAMATGADQIASKFPGVKKLEALYGYEDIWAGYALYRALRKKGQSKADVFDVYDRYYNYEKIAPIVKGRAGRKGVFSFASFPYKAAASLPRAAAKRGFMLWRPKGYVGGAASLAWNFGKWVMLAKLWSARAASQWGMTSEEMEELKRVRAYGKGWERQFMIPLFLDENKQPVFLDVAGWVPFFQFLNILGEEGRRDQPIMWLLRLNVVGSGVGEAFLQGRDFFGHKVEGWERLYRPLRTFAPGAYVSAGEKAHRKLMGWTDQSWRDLGVQMLGVKARAVTREMQLRQQVWDRIKEGLDVYREFLSPVMGKFDIEGRMIHSELEMLRNMRMRSRGIFPEIEKMERLQKHMEDR